MRRRGLRASIYRGFQSRVLRALLLPVLFSRPQRRELIFSSFINRLDPATKREAPVGWFHAASVGELEMLTPIIEKWSRTVTDAGKQVGVVITVFSESADSALERLRERLAKEGARILFAGYAPWEGQWKTALERANPDFMMTARYEAWPELWMTLASLEIPLVIIGAQARSSLQWAKRICTWLGQGIPKILFFTVGDEDIVVLGSLFPAAQIGSAGDPRWERVLQRAKAGNVRARELIEGNRALPRPWGVLGSVWAEDLKVWRPLFQAGKLKGTLWVVPHKIDDSSLGEIEAVLQESGLSFRRSTDSTKSQQRHDCVLVNEMGFLSELYLGADWAYVGGGFAQGVHNTIEPAVHGIPVACGPRKADRFPEIATLEASRQLRVIRNSEELSAWLESAQVLDGGEKPKWKAFAAAQLGASEEILNRIVPWLSGWKLQR